MGAERKYTDRDVREMPGALETVCQYLDWYQGEFDFLVDCKMRVAQNVGLSTGMIRGVLNCMRADPRFKGELPEPLPEQEGDVVKFERPGRSVRINKTRKTRLECDLEEFHGMHSWTETDEHWSGSCGGKYPINRDFTIETRVVRVNRPFVMAVSPTSLIHKTGAKAKCVWYPEVHGVGFRFTPDLHVGTLCLYPRLIKNPILMTDAEMFDRQMNEDESRVKCHRCF